MPRFFRARIEKRPNLIKILDNIGWLFFDKILRMGVGLLVGVWVARYLGPEQFGLLNFALAFVGLFAFFPTLGLANIMVRDIVNRPVQAMETLGTGFVLRTVGGLVAYVLILCIISYLRPDDTLAKTIVAILGFTQVLSGSGVIKFWFESQVQSKFTVWVENGVFLVIAAVKVVMILSGASLISFVWAAFAEVVAVALLLIAVFAWKVAPISSWQASVSRTKELLRDCWPLILSGVAFVIYMKIDQIMLGQMIGNEAVGIYSAAVRISEAWYFIPAVIVASVFPSIIEARERSETLYYQRLQKLYDLMVVLGVAIGLPMTFLSTKLICLLYGQEYIAAGLVLAVHIWAAVFVFLGIASSKWFIIENRQILTFQRNLIGAVSNVVLNFFLIPKHGAVGAAYATLLSLAATNMLYDIVQDETRPMFLMKLKSFNVLRSLKTFHRNSR